MSCLLYAMAAIQPLHFLCTYSLFYNCRPTIQLPLSHILSHMRLPLWLLYCEPTPQRVRACWLAAQLLVLLCLQPLHLMLTSLTLLVPLLLLLPSLALPPYPLVPPPMPFLLLAPLLPQRCRPLLHRSLPPPQAPRCHLAQTLAAAAAAGAPAAGSGARARARLHLGWRQTTYIHCWHAQHCWQS